MPRVVGIDPGTLSFDICGLADGEIVLETSVPSASVAREPGALLELLSEFGPLDLIAGPSGYGLPLTPIEAVGERELALMSLAEPGSNAGGPAVRGLVRLLRESGLPVVFTPGVIHLPSVPPHRKLNRVDLGTADKVCAAAWAIERQARRRGVAYRETALVLVELGGAFTALLTIVAGRIVSGQGGSSGPIGYRSAGALDAEVAWLLGDAGKHAVFSGGVAFVAGAPDAAPEAFATRDDAQARLALEAFVEGVRRAVASELSVAPGVHEIVLSGRLARIPAFREPVADALGSLGGVAPAGTDAVKEAAYGAALLADGLAGGRFEELVESLQLREAGGSVLDHVYVKAPGAVRWLARES